MPTNGIGSLGGIKFAKGFLNGLVPLTVSYGLAGILVQSDGNGSGFVKSSPHLSNICFARPKQAGLARQALNPALTDLADFSPVFSITSAVFEMASETGVVISLIFSLISFRTLF